MAQGLGGFLLLLGPGWCCDGGYREVGGVGFRCVLFCLPIMMQIKIRNSIKTKSTLILCRTSLWCVAGIFAVTNDVFVSQRGLI